MTTSIELDPFPAPAVAGRIGRLQEHLATLPAAIAQLVVRQGELLPLDVAWSVELAQTEVTVVKEERHLTKPDSTQSGTVITADQTSKVPIPGRVRS